MLVSTKLNMRQFYCGILIMSSILGMLAYPGFIFAQTYGLKFQGQYVTLDKRTELNLTPDDFLKFNDELEISFDYKIDYIEPNSLFGYVVRIINQDNNNIDLLSTPSPAIRLNLVTGVSNSIIHIPYPENAMNNWINLRIKFLLAENRMIFYTPDSFYVQEEIGFQNKDAFKIIFGANDYNQFKNTDVPSMNIKNIKLFENGKLKHHWPLGEEEGTIATDKITKHRAVVRNPIWLMSSHKNWQTKFEIEVDGDLLFASDLEGGRVFMVGANDLYVYSAGDNRINKIQYKNAAPGLNGNFSCIYNTTDKKIYCYLSEKEQLVSLDIETGVWHGSENTSDFAIEYRHHNSFYHAGENAIYLFGGYGLHNYNNTIQRIDIDKNSFDKLPSNDSVFWPRYLAGLGALNDTVYILGGYGSESGNQLINPQSFYDLFGYSVNTGEFFKKFEVTRLIDDMTLANSMYVDSISRNYYALIFEKSKFNGYLRLIKGKLGTPDIEMLDSKIPFKFLDVRSYASLIYMPKQKELLAYSSYVTDSATTRANLYAISYPPNSYIDEPKVFRNSSVHTYWYLIVAFFLVAGGAFWFFMKRKKPVSEQPKTEQPKIDAPIAEDSEKRRIIPVKPEYNQVFFGGFQVFDKNNIDITSKFSPLLKELYLLILLHTYKNSKGISSDKITEILWYDKSEKSAGNNRAVNIAKLRSIMSEIGSCELTKKTGYWKIISDTQNVKSDYADFLNLTASKTNLSKEKINKLIDITRKGAFLLNVHYEWLDGFKASVSDTIVDTLIDFAEACDIKQEPDFIIHLADSVFNFDLINEDAMILKCKAQYCMGKHSQAKATYEKFCKEYKTMYGQEYEHSFIQILKIRD